MVEVGSQQPQPFGSRVEIDLRGILGALRRFDVFRGDRAFLQQTLLALQLRARQLLVHYGLAVIGESAGDIRASDLHEQLPFFHLVPQAGVDFNNPARNQRDHRHAVRYVGTDHARGA